jgi:tRNA (Thr-GGU) A37 N-methylase
MNTGLETVPAVDVSVGVSAPLKIGTPILDLKPYLSSVPAEKLKRGWLAEAETRK